MEETQDNKIKKKLLEINNNKESIIGYLNECFMKNDKNLSDLINNKNEGDIYEYILSTIHGSAIKIQKVVKGRQTRRKKEKEDDAATTIQKHVKGIKKIKKEINKF